MAAADPGRQVRWFLAAAFVLLFSLSAPAAQSAAVVGETTVVPTATRPCPLDFDSIKLGISPARRHPVPSGNTYTPAKMSLGTHASTIRACPAPARYPVRRGYNPGFAFGVMDGRRASERA